MESIITLENIVKYFKKQIVIDNLSLSIKKGEIYGLLGANGAGKSTTINILLGFIKPNSGKSVINGIDVLKSSKETQKLIGYIPENVNLYPYLSGIENLNYFCKLNGKNYDQKKLEHILVKCGLDLHEHKVKTKNYSKGMKQKVGIAIAYAKQAIVYLLDEPASGLDPLASNDLSKLLKNLSSNGATIFMASHDIFRVRETCDRIGILKNGLLLKEMYSNDVTTKELEQIYIKYMKD